MRAGADAALRNVGTEATTILCWRPLDSRFALLEARVEKHRIWVLNEFSGRTIDLEIRMAKRRSYVEFMKGQTQSGANGKESIEQRMARRSKWLPSFHVYAERRRGLLCHSEESG